MHSLLYYLELHPLLFPHPSSSDATLKKNRKMRTSIFPPTLGQAINHPQAWDGIYCASLLLSPPITVRKPVFIHHCTMQPSIAIRSLNLFKSNCLVFAQFLPKSDKFFLDWCKTVNILQEKYFPHKYDKKYVIF